jgi:hypothetical protein
VLAAQSAARVTPEATGASWWRTLWQRLHEVGKPLLLGLALMATLTGLAAYALVSALWWLHQRWRREGAGSGAE